jgi:hypothetical protein
MRDWGMGQWAMGIEGILFIPASLTAASFIAIASVPPCPITNFFLM